MKVVFHEDFYDVYVSDPAAEPGRMEAIVDEIDGEVDFVNAKEADIEDIIRVHSEDHVTGVKQEGLYSISALAAGGAVQAAEIGLTEPSFGLIRPPGHHASVGSSWGFCYLNNMSIALEYLKSRNLIDTAFVLDFDMHYGDGNVNILENKGYVKIFNPSSYDRKIYMQEVQRELDLCNVDIIGVSAGFDNHIEDWGGVLLTEDYFEMGVMVKKASERSGGGFFAILEGGYNHDVIGKNALALIKGMG